MYFCNEFIQIGEKCATALFLAFFLRKNFLPDVKQVWEGWRAQAGLKIKYKECERMLHIYLPYYRL